MSQTAIFLTGGYYNYYISIENYVIPHSVEINDEHSTLSTCTLVLVTKRKSTLTDALSLLINRCNTFFSCIVCLILIFYFAFLGNTIKFIMVFFLSHSFCFFILVFSFQLMLFKYFFVLFPENVLLLHIHNRDTFQHYQKPFPCHTQDILLKP